MAHRYVGLPGAEEWDPLAADLATVVDLPWGIHDQRAEQWAYATPGFEPVAIGDDYPSEGVVVAFAGALTSVGTRELYADAGQEAAALVVEVADLLQTLVIDELGRPWPELHRDGSPAGLLSPGTDDHGDPCWLLGAEQVCPFGGLASLDSPLDPSVL